MTAWRRPGRCVRAEAGSVVMLGPAAVLVLLVLGAITVDSAVVFLAQRQLADRTAAAANDIAGFAVAEADLYHRGEVTLLQDQADRFVAITFDRASPPAGFDSISAVADVEGVTVVVRAEGEVRRIFAPAVPGVKQRARVTAISTATATGG